MSTVGLHSPTVMRQNRSPRQRSVRITVSKPGTGYKTHTSNKRSCNGRSRGFEPVSRHHGVYSVAKGHPTFKISGAWRYTALLQTALPCSLLLRAGPYDSFMGALDEHPGRIRGGLSKNAAQQQAAQAQAAQAAQQAQAAAAAQATQQAQEQAAQVAAAEQCSGQREAGGQRFWRVIRFVILVGIVVLLATIGRLVFAGTISSRRILRPISSIRRWQEASIDGKRLSDHHDAGSW